MLARSAPPSPEDPPDPGPEPEATGASPLAAALDGMQASLERPVDGPQWERVRRAFGDLADAARAHLLKEDVMFFPALRHLAAGRSAQVPLGLHLQGPAELLRGEHAALLSSLHNGLALLEDGGLDPSPAECRTLQTHADALGRALRDHIQLQDEGLFPSVLAGTAPMP
ncbi:hemerythrin domain-containing protein [Deinococcus sp. SDU3-2]|uniref:Hemerythrin domain-containing protein n=1 Tax=Deinococcus terrestris TaxID=2651870 RepID=A0A7X1TSR6_9DEIO|nr:hemerythrin domain-containing protein [Deinococcus terrestris]MPY67662.1 hemerythrin domain-containing protein [Deinococcus terrestris]